MPSGVRAKRCFEQGDCQKVIATNLIPGVLAQRREGDSCVIGPGIEVALEELSEILPLYQLVNFLRDRA
jgi:hypothetical protein